MKYSLLLVMVLLNSSCLTQQLKQQKELNWSDLLKSDKAMVFENKVFEEAIDFTAFLEEHLISEGVYGLSIKPSLTFINCTFQKTVVAGKKENNNILVSTFMGDLSFQECTFKGEVNFRGSRFYGKALFTNSTFKSNTNFEETTFYHSAYFTVCKFEEELRFQNSFFMQKANFMHTEYFGAANFQSTVFNAELQFGASNFYDYVDFSLIDCRAYVLFNYSEFQKRADFSNAHFNRKTDFMSTQHQQSNFSKCRFMDEVRFLDSNLTNLDGFKDAFFLLGEPLIQTEVKLEIN